MCGTAVACKCMPTAGSCVAGKAVIRLHCALLSLLASESLNRSTRVVSTIRQTASKMKQCSVCVAASDACSSRAVRSASV